MFYKLLEESLLCISLGAGVWGVYGAPPPLHTIRWRFSCWVESHRVEQPCSELSPPWCTWCVCCQRWELPESAGGLPPAGRSLACSWRCSSRTGVGASAGPPRCRASPWRCGRFPAATQTHTGVCTRDLWTTRFHRHRSKILTDLHLGLDPGPNHIGLVGKLSTQTLVVLLSGVFLN